MRVRAFLVFALSLAGHPDARAADPVPSLNLRGLRAPIDPASGISVEPVEAPATGAWSVGVWFSYAYRPVTLRVPSTNVRVFDVIRHQVTSDLTVGVGLWNRLELGVALPVLLYQTGARPGVNATWALGTYVLPGNGLGDLGLDAKVVLLRPTNGERGGFALAVDERFTMPTGDPSSFLGEASVTSDTRLLAEHRYRWIGTHVALGIKARGRPADFACGAVEVNACKSRFGHELPFVFGISVRPHGFGIDRKKRMTWFLEMHGHVPVSPMEPFTSTAASSLELDAAARLALGADVSVLGGLGTALIGGVGDTPIRALVSVSWAPRDRDRDRDGIPEDLDRCPTLPEDRDGFEDSDGCPEADNDQDRVPDGVDQCPNQAEDNDGFEDDDGCPDLDNDADGIPDKADVCPNEAGKPDATKNGCPDRDQDGIPDERDACPDEAGPAHHDPKLNGCPVTRDLDGDDILDVDDACPSVKGVPLANPKENGCPDPDPDKDTFIGDEDKCPGEAETWNGSQDNDGCPDAAPRGRPLLMLAGGGRERAPLVSLRVRLEFTSANEVGASSLLTLRALASELLSRPAWRAQVGVRPSGAVSERDAAARTKAVVAALRRYARDEHAAAPAPWATVKAAPRAAELGLGVVLAKR